MCIYAYIRIHIHPCTGGPIKTFYGGCITCSLTFDLNRYIWLVHSTQNTSSHIVSYSKTNIQSQFKKKKYIVYNIKRIIIFHYSICWYLIWQSFLNYFTLIFNSKEIFSSLNILQTLHVSHVWPIFVLEYNLVRRLMWVIFTCLLKKFNYDVSLFFP